MLSDAREFAETENPHCQANEDANKADSVCTDTEKGMPHSLLGRALCQLNISLAMNEFMD